jgi:hypothetical protein
MTPPVYEIRRGTVRTDAPFDDPVWAGAAVAEIAHVRRRAERMFRAGAGGSCGTTSVFTGCSRCTT